MRNNNLQWFVSTCEADKEPGTNDDVDYFYQHHDAHARYIYGNVLPPRDWHPYNKAGGTGAGRTLEDGPRGVPRLSLEYRWADPELHSIGQEALHEILTPATEPVYERATDHHSSHSSYLPPNHQSQGTSRYMQGGMGYGQAWDEDEMDTDLYGDESKVGNGYNSHLARD